MSEMSIEDAKRSIMKRGHPSWKKAARERRSAWHPIGRESSEFTSSSRGLSTAPPPPQWGRGGGRGGSALSLGLRV